MEAVWHGSHGTIPTCPGMGPSCGLANWTPKGESLCEMEAEFAAPQWVFRMSTYAFESEHRIICTYCERGNWRLGSLDTETGKLGPIDVPFTEIAGLRV